MTQDAQMDANVRRLREQGWTLKQITVATGLTTNQVREKLNRGGRRWR